MEKRIIILISVLLLLCVPNFVSANDNKNNSIELRNKQNGEQRTLTGTINAFYNSENLTVNLYCYSGTVCITIKENDEIIISRTINIEDGGTETFDISRLSTGNYTLLITTLYIEYNGIFKINAE